jgi:hypothetical protein
MSRRGVRTVAMVCSVRVAHMITGKGREGKGREGKGREGKGREGKSGLGIRSVH